MRLRSVRNRVFAARSDTRSVSSEGKRCRSGCWILFTVAMRSLFPATLSIVTSCSRRDSERRSADDLRSEE
jgi:hypothetical protein